MNKRFMLKKIFSKKKNLLLFVFLCIITWNIISDFKDLGLFADDIGTIYQLNQIYNFINLIKYSHSYDAARDLHQIWLKVFLIISGNNWIQNLHLIQFILYLINSILFLYILSLLEISRITKITIWILSIYFSAYSEVALWVHASSMILMSALFFLIFLILNIKLSNKNFKIKNIAAYEIILVLLSILSIETYEQPLFAIFLIILVRVLLNKYYKNNKIRFYLIIITYFFLVILFSIFKIWTALPYQTGSEINFLNNQFFFNVLKSFSSPLIELFRFNLNNYSANTFFSLFLIIVLIINFYKYSDYKKINQISFVNLIKKILLCLILYTVSFTPLFIHYISDRHFYIPSFFMWIGIGYFIDFSIVYLKIRYKNIIIASFPLIIIAILTSNAFLNFNLKKLNQIKSATMKKNFYKSIINNHNIDLLCNCFYENKIFMINFPNFYNKTIFFAHEQDVTLKLLYNDNFPKIEKISEKKRIINVKGKKVYYIYYLGIEDDNIIYKIEKK